MVQQRFVRPAPHHTHPSPNLFVANCGPAVGLSPDQIAAVFAQFGTVVGVHPADDTGARVIVSFSDETSAETALSALNSRPCPSLRDRVLHIRYSLLQPLASKVCDSISVSLDASEMGIPGIYLLRDFVTPEEEQELLAAVDMNPWMSLAKRRVQHYGYEFVYQTRNVNTKEFLGELPSFVSPVLQRVSLFSAVENAKSCILDQLTVNEYPPGVGLSPHIDTHSAFDELIFSLSLAGPCIMEFRKYPSGKWLPLSSTADSNDESFENYPSFKRRAVFLPPRSMLLMSGEARYAWNHYIPHHKVDVLDGRPIKRGYRRVSFTFRKVRAGPCECEYPEYCDSQKERGRC